MGKKTLVIVARPVLINSLVAINGLLGLSTTPSQLRLRLNRAGVPKWDEDTPYSCSFCKTSRELETILEIPA